MAISSPIIAAISAVIIAGSTVPFYQVYPGEYTATDSVGIAFQLPDYPAGCEPISLSLLLNSYSYDIGMPDIMNYFDKSSDDFVHAYWGDIYSVGAAYPPAVVEAANRYLAEQGSRLEAYDISNFSWDAIEKTVSEGRPVMLWCTSDYQHPYYYGKWEIDGYYMYANEHAVVMYDYDDTYVYVSDPLRGYTQFDKSEFETIWNLCGRMGVALYLEED